MSNGDAVFIRGQFPRCLINFSLTQLAHHAPGIPKITKHRIYKRPGGKKQFTFFAACAAKFIAAAAVTAQVGPRVRTTRVLRSQ
jgi:hypothetical protein